MGPLQKWFTLGIYVEMFKDSHNIAYIVGRNSSYSSRSIQVFWMWHYTTFRLSHEPSINHGANLTFFKLEQWWRPSLWVVSELWRFLDRWCAVPLTCRSLVASSRWHCSSVAAPVISESLASLVADPRGVNPPMAKAPRKCRPQIEGFRILGANDWKCVGLPSHFGVQRVSNHGGPFLST